MINKNRKDYVKISAVGDIGLIGKAAESIKKYGQEYAFSSIKIIFNNSDIVFGNLEIPIVDETIHENFEYELSNSRVSPDIAMALVSGGFNVLSLANNHIMDYGVRGLEFTKSFLSKANIQHVGAGLNIEKARHPVIISKSGMSVGFLAYAKNGKHSAGINLPGAVPINRSIIADDIQRLKTKVDIIVVSLHFGMIYTDYPVPEDQDLSRFIIQQGANVVICHHPHVLQGVEYFEHGVILYSLGEFIFDPTVGNIYSPAARDIRCESLIAELILEKRKASLNLIPIILNNDYCPRTCNGKDAEVILKRVESLSVSLSTKKYDFYKHASSRTISHNLSLFGFHIKKFNWKYVLLKLLRIRIVHIKILLSYIRNLVHL